MNKKAAIIGAGLGGLAASIRLAKAGFEIDVFEQNENPGGKAGSFYNSGFRFDTGPSLLTMPFIIKDLFDYTGEKISAYLQLNKLDILCKYFWDDGTIINAYSDVKKFANEIELKTKDSSLAVINYLNYSRRIYELTSDIFLFKNSKEILNYINRKAFKTLLNLKQIDFYRTMHKANSSFFNDRKTIQLFNRYATYNGSSPYKAPATFNLIQHVEYNLGGYTAKGGIYSVTEALYNLSKKSGVKFHFTNMVERINHSNGKISGLQVSDEVKQYDIILSNVDATKTYRSFINAKTNINHKYLSSSAIVFYWGVKGNYDFTEIHNILFSSDYKKEFDDIFVRKICPDDPTIYIYISSKLNPDDAPDGCENWFIMINTPPIENQDWEKETEKTRINILKKIKKILDIDLKDKILSENILTPEILEDRTGAYKGSIYGPSSNSIFSAFLRHSNKSKKYKGLYFCGGSVNPGGGIPLVLLSGKNAADLIIKDYD